MAKTATQGTLDPAIEAKARRMIDNIRRFYRLGQRANLQEKDLSTAEFAAANGVNIYTMRTARRFAREYDEQALDELCSVRRPNGLPLHWGRAHYLLTSPRGKRRSFAKKAAKEGWGAQQLRVAIQAECRRGGHKKRSGGRRMKEPVSAEAGVLQLIADSELWCRRAELAQQKVEEETSPSAALRTRIADTAAKLQVVETAAKQVRKALESIARSGGKRR